MKQPQAIAGMNYEQRRRFALEWLKYTEGHLTACEDENCELVWAFLRFRCWVAIISIRSSY